MSFANLYPAKVSWKTKFAMIAISITEKQPLRQVIACLEDFLMPWMLKIQIVRDCLCVKHLKKHQNWDLLGKRWPKWRGKYENCYTLMKSIVANKSFSSNAHSWLSSLDKGLHNETEKAGTLGGDIINCEVIYPCHHTPKSYRYIHKIISKVKHENLLLVLLDVCLFAV